jgi:uncharacterized protein (DUF305 family)
MRRISTGTLAVLAATAALAVAGCGDDDASSSESSSGNGVDRAFVADMIPHHESAIEMAKIAQQRGESAFVKELADDIATSQSNEIATMRREDEALELAGVKPGSLGVPGHMMGMDDDPATLKSADPFDEAFIKMMIPHHEGAIEMAKVELAKGEDPELKALAQDITDAQQREISDMRKHLGDTGSTDANDDEHGAGHSG